MLIIVKKIYVLLFNKFTEWFSEKLLTEKSQQMMQT